jgi:L-ascorbate metabolism protein UlaG (beta-lactamase superfamily)
MLAKHSTLLFLLFFLSYQISFAQEKVSYDRMIDEIKAHTQGLAIWWTGHNGWLIKYNDVLIGTDLALESEDRLVPSPISATELAEELDISFVSHEHGDHFERETSKILAKNGNCVFVMPSTSKGIAINEVGIPEHRINVATPRVPFNIGDVKIEPIRAIHGNSKFAVY